MKRILSFLFIFVLSLGMVGCNSQNVKSTKPQVYTSFYAIYDFTKEIAGDYVDVYNMVPTGTEPHDWEPTVQDMAKLNDADAVFYNGLNMESWINKVQNSLDSSKFVCLSDGINVDDGASDPHIWLNPKNVKVMCDNIYTTLSKIDPDNKEFYETNYNNYVAKLDKLDNDFKTTIEQLPNKNIVVSHEAYSYLCDVYGLNQVAIDGISADSEPSPDKMLSLINFVKTNNIKYIFYEELVSPKTAGTLSNETGAKLLPLNPFEGLTDEEIAKGDNYISVMYENLENIKTALS